MPLTTPQQIEQHIARIMAFYHPRCIDPQAGFHHYLTEDGDLYNRHRRHLLSSTQYVINYARYAMHTGNAEYLAWARHGLKYLEEAHFRTRTQGYAWVLDHGEPNDDIQHCDGLAFVLLAYATALQAGILEAREGLYRAHDTQHRHFFESRWHLYAADADAHWHLGPYRGQLANLRSCEALLAAYAATQDDRFLDLAQRTAGAVWQRLAPMGDGWIWEHYDADWKIDFDYHRDRPDDWLRPWGFQIGHQTAWARLLVTLAGLRPGEEWMLPTAKRLFIEAVDAGWDRKHGGLIYGVDFNRAPLNRDKVYWVQAGSLAAAARLGECTGEARYWRWYDRIANYCWQHMVDHEHGAWYRVLTADNRRYSKEKSPAGKTDYHTLDACYDMLSIMRRQHGERARASGLR